MTQKENFYRKVQEGYFTYLTTFSTIVDFNYEFSYVEEESLELIKVCFVLDRDGFSVKAVNGNIDTEAYLKLWEDSKPSRAMSNYGRSFSDYFKFYCGMVWGLPIKSKDNE